MKDGSLFNRFFQVIPVLELAELEVRKRQLIPDNLSIKWIPYDDKCDASYATISAMDGYGMDCGHVLFGPICDYSLGKYRHIFLFVMHFHKLVYYMCSSCSFIYSKITWDSKGISCLQSEILCKFILQICTREKKFSRSVSISTVSSKFRIKGEETCLHFVTHLHTHSSNERKIAWNATDVVGNQLYRSSFDIFRFKLNQTRK